MSILVSSALIVKARDRKSLDILRWYILRREPSSESCIPLSSQNTALTVIYGSSQDISVLVDPIVEHFSSGQDFIRQPESKAAIAHARHQRCLSSRATDYSHGRVEYTTRVAVQSQPHYKYHSSGCSIPPGMQLLLLPTHFFTVTFFALPSPV